MGHDLADGEDKVEASLSDEPVHLRRPCIIQLAFRLLADKFRRNFAEGLNIGSPVMHAEQLLRHGAEHSLDLICPHARMRAQSRQTLFQPPPAILPRLTRKFPRPPTA